MSAPRRGERPPGDASLLHDVPRAPDLPYLTTEQMVEVDRAMVEDYRIDLVQMMENAGRALAVLARLRFLDGEARGRRVDVFAGTGGNGGGALVAARRLAGWGADVRVYVAADDAVFALVPAHQLGIVRRMGIPVGRPVGPDAAADSGVVAAGSGAVGESSRAAGEIDLVVDGVIGYGLRGSPRGEAAGLIRRAGTQGAPILSLDVPSGLDATSGTVYEPAVAASATLTLALPKQGLRAPAAAEHVGELYVADIGVPPELYSRPPLRLDVGPLFARAEILRIGGGP